MLEEPEVMVPPGASFDEITLRRGKLVASTCVLLPYLLVSALDEVTIPSLLA